jgi:hypothetical protein
MCTKCLTETVRSDGRGWHDVASTLPSFSKVSSLRSEKKSSFYQGPRVDSRTLGTIGPRDVGLLLLDCKFLRLNGWQLLATEKSQIHIKTPWHDQAVGSRSRAQSTQPSKTKVHVDIITTSALQNCGAQDFYVGSAMANYNQ